MMRWPLVPRGTLQRAVEAAAMAHDARLRAESACDQERADRISERDAHRFALKMVEERHERETVRAEARYADLMASYRMLRLTGAQPGPDPRDVPNAPPRDPVLEAVNRFAKDERTRVLMLKQVAADRIANPDLTDVELVARIERGHRPADDIA